MPTIPASTGGSAGWNGKLASLPRTKNTSSPTPAPTASTATNGRPAGSPSGVSGWTMSSVMPARLSSLRVITTSPITRASCIRIHLFVHVDRVDDTDNRGVDRTVLQARRHPRGAAADDEHGLAHAGVDGVDDLGQEHDSMEREGFQPSVSARLKGYALRVDTYALTAVVLPMGSASS